MPSHPAEESVPENVTIGFLQVASILAMWVFLLGVVGWMVHLVLLSRRLDDSAIASLLISVCASLAYVLIAGVLTYVFFGLRRGNQRVTEDLDHER